MRYREAVILLLLLRFSGVLLEKQVPLILIRFHILDYFVVEGGVNRMHVPSVCQSTFFAKKIFPISLLYLRSHLHLLRHLILILNLFLHFQVLLPTVNETKVKSFSSFHLISRVGEHHKHILALPRVCALSVVRVQKAQNQRPTVLIEERRNTSVSLALCSRDGLRIVEALDEPQSAFRYEPAQSGPPV